MGTLNNACVIYSIDDLPLKWHYVYRDSFYITPLEEFNKLIVSTEDINKNSGFCS